MTVNYKDISSFSIFFSASTTQKLLRDFYLRNNIVHAEQKSFENCYRFIYLLKHGQLYYKQATIAPLALKPTLLFYGLVHFMKACILTVKPDYPETTTMLAHGVSTRKKKKQQYDFFLDEVRCQRNGLFPIMIESMFHLKQLDGEKLPMQLLFEHIPELTDVFHFLNHRHTFAKVHPIDDHLFAIDQIVLDRYHMTENRFATFLKEKCSFPIEVCPSQNNKQLHLITKGFSMTDALPFKYNVDKQQYYIPLHNHFISFYPEIALHYLLLYNLGMIARYETEWWSELIHSMPNRDYPFIETFLQITTNKSPLLLFDYLISRLQPSHK